MINKLSKDKDIAKLQAEHDKFTQLVAKEEEQARALVEKQNLEEAKLLQRQLEK